jgi:cell wall-associated NlpC family hydrolase
MAIPVLAVAGVIVGALGSGAVLLAGVAGSLALGPLGLPTSIGAPTGTAATSASASAQSTSPAISPTLVAELEQTAAASCPGLDWALLGGAVLVNPSVAADIASVATDLCPYPPGDRPAGLAGLMTGPTVGQAAVVLAHALDADPGLTEVAAVAITFAAVNLGTPYRWGGTGAGGFDCSGLTEQAYKAAGVAIPRVAQDQFDAGPAVPAPEAPEPGDLVFFGQGPHDVSHVGLSIGAGVMIDAPHTGAFVRIEPTPTSPGARFGSDIYVGATRP